ncbi:hypothetical protein WBP06_01935 [Novosphingobium sp. BL-8H]|uniref:hypothetical protein n=1 Tax=Novosphingobium sp. BL-8H TaxID=3127640 RepID=UPI0037568246
MNVRLLAAAAICAASFPTAALAQAVSAANDPRLNNQRDAFGVSSRQAAHMCLAAAEKALQAAGYTGVQVVGLKQIESKAEGYELEAWVSVSGGGPAWRGADGDKGGPLRGTVDCEVKRGSIVDLDFDDIPGV